jgi:hypothetical protein
MKDPNHCWVVLGFVITSQSRFLKIFKFKQPVCWVFIKTSDESNFRFWVFEKNSKDWLVSSKNQLRTKDSG